MLTVLGRPQTVCNGLTRRKLLELGGAGLFGLSLPKILAAEPVQPPRAPRVDYQAGLGNDGLTPCDAGKLDAVTANDRDRSITVLLGVGDGTFQTAVTAPKVLRLENGRWQAAEAIAR